MASIKSQPSPIDLAVQSLTTFTGSRAPDEEDWHSQFAADIDEDDLARPQQVSSTRISPGGEIAIQQAQCEELVTEKDREKSGDVPPAERSASSNQQSLPNFTPFTRPSSSHEDISTSFAFGRPQPKQFDFSRKKPQDSKISAPAPMPEPISNTHILPESRPCPDMNTKLVEAAATGEVGPVASEPVNTSRSMSASPTLVAIVPDAGNPSCHRSINTALQNSNTRTSVATDPQGCPVAAPKTVGASQYIPLKQPQSPGRPAIANQLASPRVPTKITKLRRKSRPRTDPNFSRGSDPAEPNASLSYEDTLGVLSVLYQKEQIQREQERAALKAKETELQDLREISNAIYSQLQQVRQREKSQEAELFRFRKSKPQWEARVKKISDYVQSLIKDHDALREDAQEIRHQQKILQTEKCELASALKGIHETVENDQGKTEKVFVEARHHMEMLEQKIGHQERQLREDTDLLDAERARSQLLDDKMSKVSNGHEHLHKLLTEQRLIIMGKLDDLLRESREVKNIAPPPSQDYVKPMLEEAVSLLKGLREAKAIRPEDVRRLDASIRAYADRITGSVQACERAITISGAHQKGFASEFQERLQALSTNIAGEHVLNERVTDLREVKATLKERLQATEAALAEARRQSVTLQTKDQLQLQKISALELEAANLRSQPKESLHAALHIHELEAQNKGLMERSSSLQKQIADIALKLQVKIEEASEAETRVNSLQAQLKETQAERLALEEQGLAYKDQANAKLEQTQKELWKAANLDKSRVESDYENQLHKLRQHKEEISSELEQKIRQVDHLRAELEQRISQIGQLQAEKTAAEARARQDSSLLADLQAEKAKEHQAATTSQFQATLLETEAKKKDERLGLLEEELRHIKSDLKARNADIQKLGHTEEKLRAITDEIKAKDAQIQKLTATNASSVETNPVETSNPKDQEHLKRKANRAEKRLPSVVEDSQPNEIQTSAAVKVMSAKSNRTSTPSRHGRLTDIAGMSSPLEDLDYMLDDLGDLADIFSPHPLGKSQDLGPSKKVTSQDTLNPRGKGKEEGSPARRLTASRESSSTTHKSIHFSVPNNRPAITATSSVSKAHHAGLLAQEPAQDKHDARRQQTVSSQSSRQHSILKRSATVEKRSASVARLSPSGSCNRNKRTRDLGPVIEDSQSPHGSRIPARNHRPAKMNSRKQPKDDKYSRRFSQELSQDL